MGQSYKVRRHQAGVITATFHNVPLGEPPAPRRGQSNKFQFAALHMSLTDAVDGSSTRHVSAMEVGADKAPTIRRSYPCKPLRQSVSTSQNQCFRCTALMLPAR